MPFRQPEPTSGTRYHCTSTLPRRWLYSNSVLNFICFVFPSLDFPQYDFSVVLAVSVATEATVKLIDWLIDKPTVWSCKLGPARCIAGAGAWFSLTSVGHLTQTAVLVTVLCYLLTCLKACLHMLLYSQRSSSCISRADTLKRDFSYSPYSQVYAHALQVSPSTFIYLSICLKRRD